ncbi:hypothetical protein SAMN04487898_10615 [Pedobacter sp. ok626]|nr:hypothetical protein SAMN04487898_10615 [Pedobacter sp. ok626]
MMRKSGMENKLDQKTKSFVDLENKVLYLHLDKNKQFKNNN